MRVLSVPVAFLIVAVALSGCADDSQPVPEGDPVLDDLDLQATDETGVVRGVVIDAAITPVVGATVAIESLGLSTTTNDNGAFGFSDLEPGTYFLHAEKPGFTTVQSSTEVIAGVSEPPVLKLLMEHEPGTAPFIEGLFFTGRLSCGAAIFATSVGCTTNSAVASAIGDQSIFSVDYLSVPQWIQGELVWEATQPAAGAFIWEITAQGSNSHLGYRETEGSPALAYLNETAAQANAAVIMDSGLNFRFFGGPHELCRSPSPPSGVPNVAPFGCGLTLEQETEVFVHNFYNLLPDEGWRFTSDGAHGVPS